MLYSFIGPSFAVLHYNSDNYSIRVQRICGINGLILGVLSGDEENPLYSEEAIFEKFRWICYLFCQVIRNAVWRPMPMSDYLTKPINKKKIINKNYGNLVR